jgi:hypothetical protein
MNQQAIDNARILLPDLWAIEHLLTPEEFVILTDLLEKENTWNKVDLQEHLSREECAWQIDGLCDWLWEKLSNLDFSRFGLQFRTVTVWRDMPGYCIRNHVDNDRVVAAMQIYLSESKPGLGTWFNDTVEIPFITNTGYLMHNRNHLIHGMKNSVPNGYVRKSLYAWFDQVKS